jgi:hypothetical protein
MTRTKKNFITFFESKYITIEFYDGKRGILGNGYGMEGATENTIKCSKRGGTCFIFPVKYADGIIKFISYIEKETKEFIDLEVFQKSIPAIIQKIDNKEGH